eukprot:SAG31_NODE_7997_length_1544_cov_2.191696_3_plen_141_part_00
MASGKEREKTPTPSSDTGLEWVSYDWAQYGDYGYLRFILKINPQRAIARKLQRADDCATNDRLPGCSELAALEAAECRAALGIAEARIQITWNNKAESKSRLLHVLGSPSPFLSSWLHTVVFPAYVDLNLVVLIATIKFS